jgi:hypothetical protein
MRFLNGSTLGSLVRATQPNLTGLCRFVRNQSHLGPLWGKTFDD